ncbi:O-antigen ligase family protein [Bacillus paranthracis]|uniref:O-antigen ligase family protein n=1 Tax=Bacillus paranthracis TaxID=2026186 RepID=UPI00254EF8FE|nr:O-antigen ligase family protein [Bacillus paranthracis]MDK7539263.1 O-antigen ligase family protein [Bacillus paranthracis]MDK7561795.1 O-antigen ligase family protein [Bacillus paranthracis]
MNIEKNNEGSWINNSERKYRRMVDKVNVCYTIIFFGVFLFTWYKVAFFNLFSGISSLLFIVNVLLLIIHLPLIISKKINLFLFTITLLILMLLNSIFSNSNLGSSIVLFNLVIMMVLFSFFRLKEKAIKCISTMMLIYLLFYCFVQKEMFNTNSIGYIILLTYIYSTFYLSTLKLKGIFIPVITMISCYFIYLTDSRGALLGLCLFTLLAFIIPSKIWSKKINLFLLNFLLSIGSLIFVYTYIHLWQNRFNISLELFDKPLFTGREAIWTELFYSFKEHPIVGLGSNYNIVSYGNLNVHNSMFNILVIYGIPVFCMVVFLIWKNLLSLSESISRSVFSRIAVSGFYGILLVGFFETNLVWASNIFPAIFLIAIAYSSREISENASKVK